MTSASRSRRRDGELPSATISEFDGVRYLHLGDTPWVQGAMRLRKPRSLELDYVQRMMAWLLLRDPAVLDDTRVVQLGLALDAQLAADVLAVRLDGAHAQVVLGGDLLARHAARQAGEDLGLALDEARVNGATLPVAALVDQFYAEVQGAGGGRLDTSSLVTRLPK